MSKKDKIKQIILSYSDERTNSLGIKWIRFLKSDLDSMADEIENLD